MSAIPFIILALVILAGLIYFAVWVLRDRRETNRKIAGEWYYQWLALRPTDQFRTEYISKLAEAYAVGQLSIEEYRQRNEIIYAATKNADVVATVKDLEAKGRRE